ncbi:MAG: hypothetical protein JW834_04860 [Candidatus Diapherotrites archaeon]|nr:hypothetical protein [Candidatus Diapherotrites archaeon]
MAVIVMGTFIAIEVGDSAYTELKTKAGGFEQTDDGVYLGEYNAINEQEARKAVHNQYPDKQFDCLVLKKMRPPNNSTRQ